MRKQQNFTQPSITTTYAGEFAGKYIAAALLSARTLDNNYITIVPNVKYRQIIQRVDVDSIVNDAFIWASILAAETPNICWLAPFTPTILKLASVCSRWSLVRPQTFDRSHFNCRVPFVLGFAGSSISVTCISNL